MSLWPHQAADIAAFERERRYRQRLCLVRPTGMGKTRTMRELAVRELEQGGRVVVYTHRKLLIDQLFRTFDDAGIECGIRAAGYGKNDDALVQIVSTQTESSRTLRTPRKIAALRKKAEQVDDLAESVKTAAEIARLSAKNHGRASGSLVIVDEAHVQKGLEIRELVNRHVAEEATILGVTATPVDLEDLYEGIIGNGYTSEGRSCGALVQAVHYAPDEPDMRRFAKWTPGDELTERQAEKAIIRDGVIGRVSKWYRKTNPEQKPSILFGPSVNGSQWFAEELSKSGIRSAHLDGENCWLDGKLYPSDRKAREEIIEMSRTGDVKILCNRFVLREGVDCPWLEHGILATVFGGVSTYLQSGGRLLRASPSTGKTVACLARGTKILTARGEVEIQDVTKDDLIWDGVDFVTSDGPVLTGHKKVIEWDGVTATPNHKVHTHHGWEQISEAKAGNRRITCSGDGRHPVWVSDHSNPYGRRDRATPPRGGGLLFVQPEVNDAAAQNGTSHASRLQEVHEALRGSLPGVGVPPRPASVEAVQRSEGHYISPLRRQGNPVQVPVSVGRGVLDRCKPWGSGRSEDDDRPGEERWSLRAWEPAVGFSVHADEEPRQVHPEQVEVQGVPCELPGCEVFEGVLGRNVPSRDDRRPDCEEVEVEVWDILNCGPRNRYTANGRLVANCIQDHGGNWWRHGSLNADRDWTLGDTSRMVAARREAGMRKPKAPHEAEPFLCPACKRTWLSGRVCSCGHTLTGAKSREVTQHDGRLVKVEGSALPPRKEKEEPDTAKKWERVFWAARKSDEGRTFRQARSVFFYHHGYWPPDTLPLMPLDEGDWFKRVRDVPFERLRPKEK